MGHVEVPTVGIIGLGSIGRRHAAELHALGAKVVALRRRESRNGPELDLSFVEEVYDLGAFWKHELDAVVVANPTSLHIESATDALVRTQCPVFVEKPLAVSTAEAALIPNDERARIRVGYCLRFHSVVRAVTSTLVAGSLGRVVAGRLRFGSHLADWYRGGDYRARYVGRSELGGGALRTLSHELDLVQHWLGRVDKVAGLVGTVSPLGLDVDDIAQLSCQTESGAMVAIELDFFTPGYERAGYLIGTAGRLDYSLNPNACTMKLTGTAGNDYEARFGGINEMYAAQARDLLRWARDGSSAACSFYEARHVLEIVEAAERSPSANVISTPAG